MNLTRCCIIGCLNHLMLHQHGPHCFALISVVEPISRDAIAHAHAGAQPESIVHNTQHTHGIKSPSEASSSSSSSSCGYQNPKQSKNNTAHARIVGQPKRSACGAEMSECVCDLAYRKPASDRLTHAFSSDHERVCCAVWNRLHGGGSIPLPVIVRRVCVVRCVCVCMDGASQHSTQHMRLV